jgi:hypothetical protein
MSCVMMVSRSRPPLVKSMLAARSSWLAPLLVCVLDPAKAVYGVLLGEEVSMMVRQRSGIPSFFVSRMEAEVAPSPDLRARCRGASGTSRLMVLFAADSVA